MKPVVLLLCILFIACSQLKQDDRITKISITKNKEIGERAFVYKFIPLETNNDCLFRGIGTIQIVDDKIYIIDSKDEKLLVFDISGKFITQVGKRGSGPGEYVSPCSFHVDIVRRVLTIGDNNGLKLLHYNLDTYKYLFSQKTPFFSECAWLPDGNIAWIFPLGYKNETNKETYYIKITDSNLKEINLLYASFYSPEYLAICGRDFYTLNDMCYVNMAFSPIIYKVESDKLTPIYKIDLGSQKFASLDWLQQNAAEDYTSALIASDYITTHNVKETNDWISVFYYMKRGILFISFYNKKNATSYKFTGSEFINVTGLTGMGLIKGTYDNCFIIPLFADALKRHNSKLKDLQPIIEKMKEDDNVVLCLFSIK